MTDPSAPLPPPDASPGGVVTDHRPPTVMLLDPPPRAGELTLAWRIGTASAWICVVLALAAVWNASVQLGLSTWWLGPRGDPQPRAIQLAPFVAPVLVVLATINNARWLAWYGLAASGVVAAVGLGDLGRVGSIAATELAIAASAALVSIASLTGTYRAPLDRDPPDPADPVERDPADPPASPTGADR